MMLPEPVGPNQWVKSLLWARIPAAATSAQGIQPFQNPETPSYPLAVPVQLCTETRTEGLTNPKSQKKK